MRRAVCSKQAGGQPFLMWWRFAPCRRLGMPNRMVLRGGGAMHGGMMRWLTCGVGIVVVSKV